MQYQSKLGFDLEDFGDFDSQVDAECHVIDEFTGASHDADKSIHLAEAAI